MIIKINRENKKQIIQGQINSKNLQISDYKSIVNSKYFNNYVMPQSDGKLLFIL